MAFSQLVKSYNHVDAGGDLFGHQVPFNTFPSITNGDNHWSTSEYCGTRKEKYTFALTKSGNIRNMMERVMGMSADLTMRINFE